MLTSLKLLEIVALTVATIVCFSQFSSDKWLAIITLLVVVLINILNREKLEQQMRQKLIPKINAIIPAEEEKILEFAPLPEANLFENSAPLNMNKLLSQLDAQAIEARFANVEQELIKIVHKIPTSEDLIGLIVDINSTKAKDDETENLGANLSINGSVNTLENSLHIPPLENVPVLPVNSGSINSSLNEMEWDSLNVRFLLIEEAISQLGKEVKLLDQENQAVIKPHLKKLIKTVKSIIKNETT